jgi:hypothetical protein
MQKTILYVGGPVSTRVDVLPDRELRKCIQSLAPRFGLGETQTHVMETVYLEAFEFDSLNGKISVFCPEGSPEYAFFNNTENQSYIYQAIKAIARMITLSK